MNRKILNNIALLLLCLWWNKSYSQSEIGLTKCPTERIEVHISGENFFTGEIVWFKIYCTSQGNGGRQISNIAFVELINSDKTSVVRKKILLKDGCGTGEFVIPDNLQTGIYYLLSYTNWMKNFGEASFFIKGLGVINPNQQLIGRIDLKDPPESNTDLSDTIPNTDPLKILTDREEYARRDPVVITIKPNDISMGKITGSYSVSVYHKGPSMIFGTGVGRNEIPEEPMKITYLPDYMGIRMSGVVTDHSGNVIPNMLVTVSTPGPGTYLSSCKTDNEGVFHFLLKPEEGEKDIILTLAGDETKYQLEESFWNRISTLPDNQYLYLNRESVSYLQEKYNLLQIGTRFKRSDVDKIEQTEKDRDTSVFYTKPFEIIELDKYQKLDSLREYFYEFVPEVKFSGRKSGYQISVYDPVSMRNLEEQPGIFIDGVLYGNFSEISKIPVQEIDRIVIIPSEYYYKDCTFGGVIDIHTKKSDFSFVRPLPNMYRFKYPLADINKWKFKLPAYPVRDSLTRIPDFRYLLYWDPDVKVDNSGETRVCFYAGDLEGVFIIKITGISEKGEILKVEKELSVNH